MATHSPQSPSRAVGLSVLAFLALFSGLVAWSYLPFGQSSEAVAQAPEDAPLATLTLETGDVVIRLRPDLAPNHVERITELANAGFYDGIVFHRVIPRFMAQTGDPTGTGMGGSHLPDLRAEFTNTPFVRGTVGMARSRSFDSANSQFFIVTQDARHLDPDYTLWGEVISGMELVDGIKQGTAANEGIVANPDKIVSMRVSTTD